MPKIRLEPSYVQLNLEAERRPSSPCQPQRKRPFIKTQAMANSSRKATPRGTRKPHLASVFRLADARNADGGSASWKVILRNRDRLTPRPRDTVPDFVPPRTRRY